MESRFVDRGHAVAVKRASSYFSEIGMAMELMDGIAYYEFIADLLAHYEERKEALIVKLGQVQEYFFAKDCMQISVTADGEGYRLVEELYGISKKAGHDVNVYNVYHAGCTLKDHWTWLTDAEAGKGQYGMWETNDTGWKKIMTDVSIHDALPHAEWDVIVLQPYISPGKTVTNDAALQSTQPYAENYVKYLRDNFPNAEILLFEHWA